MTSPSPTALGCRLDAAEAQTAATSARRICGRRMADPSARIPAPSYNTRPMPRSAAPIFAALAVLAAITLACAGTPITEQQPGWSARSDSGRLTGRLAPEGDASVQIGQFQTWILELREASGAAVAGA